MSFTVELIWLPSYVKLSTAFISTLVNVLIEPCWFEIYILCFKRINITFNIFGSIF